MAGAGLKKSEKDDFDPSTLVAAQDVHEKSISSLNERVTKVEGNLSTPQALAAFFKEATSDSRVLDNTFAEMFCRFMNEHEGVQAALTKKIEESDRISFSRP